MLENVESLFGSRSNCDLLSAEESVVYSDQVPQALLEEWHQRGICTFGQGILWFVHPASMREISQMWTHEEPPPACIARTAFGDLIVWDEFRGALFIDVVYDEVHELGTDIEKVFGTVVCSEDFRADLLRQSTFEQALKRLGRLASDEVYGFEPAPALGGSATVDTLRRVKLNEYLSLLNDFR